MEYTQVEADVVARLVSKLPNGVTVVPLPESEAELRKPFQNARVTVCYKGSDYGDGSQGGMLRSTAQVSQNETLQLEVVIQSRFLRDKAFACYPLLSAVKKALIGFEPTHCHKMYARKNDWLANDQEPADLFTYVCSFECTTLVVEEYDTTAEDGARITQITLEDEVYGNTVVPG